MDKTSSPPINANQYPTATAAGNASSPQTTGERFSGVNSTDLLRGEKTVEINHNGATYRLQATRLGKLILTK